MINSFISKRPLLFSVLLTAFFFAASYFCILPFFENNDDAGFMLLLSGKVFSNYPENQIFFLNILLSSLIAFIYDAAPSVPWYGVLHIVGLISSVLTLVYITIKRLPHWSTIFIIIFFCLFFVLENIIALQFTRTAFLLCLAGISMFIFSINQETLNESKNKSIATILWAGSLIFVGFMFRKESFFLAIALTIPAILFIPARNILNKRNIATLLLLSCFVVVPSMAQIITYDLDDNWNYFSQLNKEKSKLAMDNWGQGRSSIPESSLFLAGWSKNDFRMASAWGYANRSIFSLESFKTVNKLNQARGEFLSSAKKSMMQFYSSVLKNDRHFILLLFFIVIISFIYRNSWKKSLFTTSMATIVLIAILLWQKLPPRIFTPAVTAIAFQIIFFQKSHACRLNQANRIKAFTIIMIVFILGFSIQNTMPNLYSRSKLINSHATQLANALQTINKHQAKRILVVGNHIPLELILPFGDKSFLDHLQFLHIGLYNQSPIQEKLIHSLGIKDPFLALIEKNYSLACDPIFSLVTKKYFREHYNLDLTYSIKSTSPYFTLYSFE